VSAVIYLEGGGQSKSQHLRCQEGFHKLLHGMGLGGRKPRLVACGGRGQAFDRFRTAMRQHRDGYTGLWIDSEEPMRDFEQAWGHLKDSDNWEKPGDATDEQVLLMVTCMEAWIVADRPTLKLFYGSAFQEKSLPPLHDLEARPRREVQVALERATASCPGPYRKGDHSFMLLGRLNPQALRQLASFRRVERILLGTMVG
jgi:hypothetical protein